MDDALLADSNRDTVEKMFEEVKKSLPCWGLQTTPKKYKEETLLITQDIK